MFGHDYCATAAGHEKHQRPREPSDFAIARDAQHRSKDQADQKALAFVSARYGKHRITIVEGDSQRTLTEYYRVYGELCDVISVDGAHDTRAYADFANLRRYANPTRHVLLADDCVSRTVYEKVKSQRPDVMWFGGVWDSWRRIVDEEGQVWEKATYVYGGENEPWIEPFSGCLKGWCEGEYNVAEVSQ